MATGIGRAKPQIRQRHSWVQTAQRFVCKRRVGSRSPWGARDSSSRSSSNAPSARRRRLGSTFAAQGGLVDSRREECGRLCLPTDFAE